MTVAVLVFAVCGRNRDWMPRWQQNWFGWSFKVAVVACILEWVVGQYFRTVFSISLIVNIICCFFFICRCYSLIWRNQHQTGQELHGKNVHSKETSISSCTQIDSSYSQTIFCFQFCSVNKESNRSTSLHSVLHTHSGYLFLSIGFGPSKFLVLFINNKTYIDLISTQLLKFIT